MMTRTAQRVALMICLLGAVTAVGTARATAAINIVASTPELADIAKQVGGNKVSVYSVARPDEDYHRMEARPSQVAQIARAKLVVRIGMDLDLWMDALLNAAGNRSVNKGGAGYVDASAQIRKLEVPRGGITGASGDIHVYGNPHYWFDPANAKIVAGEILAGLKRVAPRDAAFFQKHHDAFCNKTDQRLADWAKTLAPYRGRSVVVYHKEWVYFLQRFGLREAGALEPKPGIPPSAGHIARVIDDMKAQKVGAIIVPTIYPMKFPNMVAKATGAKVAVVPYSVGSLKTKDYFGYIDLIVRRFKDALA
jgi:zinc/manganese transport system substrate-binding protein